MCFSKGVQVSIFSSDGSSTKSGPGQEQHCGCRGVGRVSQKVTLMMMTFMMTMIKMMLTTMIICRVQDNVHDDMIMNVIIHDQQPVVHSYDQHIIMYDQ